MGWRLPTHAEHVALHALPGDASGQNGYWAEANARGNAVAGKFYGITAMRGQAGGCTLPSDMTGCIFLPVSGYRNNNSGALYEETTRGLYWSSTQSNANNAYGLDTNTNGTGSHGKAFGFAIRCVQ